MVSILIIPLEISILLTRIVKEQGIVGLGAINKPAHGTDDVGLGWAHDRVALVICQNDHVLALIAISLNQECRHVVDIVDASLELGLCAKIVDSNQQCLSLSCAVGVLEGVAARSTVTKLLRGRGRRGTGFGVHGSRRVERIAVGI